MLRVPSTAKAYLTGVALSQILSLLLCRGVLGAALGRSRPRRPRGRSEQPKSLLIESLMISDQCVAHHPQGNVFPSTIFNMHRETSKKNEGYIYQNCAGITVKGCIFKNIRKT